MLMRLRLGRIGAACSVLVCIASAGQASPPAVRWTHRAPGWGEPAATGALAYFMTREHEVVALEAATGALRWRVSTGGRGDTPWGTATAITGTWTGTVTDQLRGVGQLRFTARGIDTTATGTFTLSFTGGTNELSGDVTVSATDQPTIDLFFRARGAPGCPPGEGSVLHARTALTGSRMTGTYRDLLACGFIGGGSIEVTRQ